MEAEKAGHSLHHVLQSFASSQDRGSFLICQRPRHLRLTALSSLHACLPVHTFLPIG